MATATITTNHGTVINLVDIKAESAFGCDWDGKGIQWRSICGGDNGWDISYSTNPRGEGLYTMGGDGPRQHLGNGQFNVTGSRLTKARVHKLAKKVAEVSIGKFELEDGYAIEVKMA
jgi:hypothetical protein